MPTVNVIQEAGMLMPTRVFTTNLKALEYLMAEGCDKMYDPKRNAYYTPNKRLAGKLLKRDGYCELVSKRGLSRIVRLDLIKY